MNPAAPSRPARRLAAALLVVAGASGTALVAAAWIAGGRRPARAGVLVAMLPNRAFAMAHDGQALRTIGTVALPAPPRTVALPAPLATAEPFRFGPASAVDRGRALACLTAAVYYEAGAEPPDGQRAVAQAVLNRVRHPAFPPTVCGVVYQGSDRSGCQFSFACDGALARRSPEAAGWARATRVAAQALAGQVYAPIGLATHYHTFAVTPAWNRGLVMTAAVGAHFFHRWKGWWGTPAAFSRSYRGEEPMPGPSTVQSLPVIAAAPMVQPFHRDGSAPSLPANTTTADDTLPPAASVLPRWRHSGEPLH